MALTQKQQDVVDYRGGHLLVSASAGSGKTTTMIGRLVNLLAQGESLDNIAVVTFTNDSAADMRAKLSRELNKMTDDSHIAEEIKLLPQAEIGTLHSWCSKLIKSYFYASDVDPDFEILNDSDASQALALAAEKVIEEEIEGADLQFNLLYDCMLTSRKHRRLAENIIRLYNYSRAQKNPQQFLDGINLPNHAESLAALNNQLLDKAKLLLNKAKDIYMEICAAGLMLDEPQAAQIVESLASCRITENGFLLPPNDLGNAKPLSSNDLNYDLHEKFKNLKSEFLQLYKDNEIIASLATPDETKPFYEVFKRLVKRCGEVYLAYKKSNAALDYSDLEHEALKILQSVYIDDISEKYHYIFVDEYQDINPLQEEILSSFIGTKMFYVGDVKQSIYGFRMCAPEFFIKKRDKFLCGTDGKVVTLNANFRSDNKILEFANKVFSKIMTKEFGGEDYARDGAFEKSKEIGGFVSAYLIRPPEQENALEPKIYSVLEHEYDENPTLVQMEVNAVISHIMQLKNRSIPIDNLSAESLTRPAEYSDIAVLVKTRGSFSAELARACKQYEIPLSFAKDSEIGDFVSVVNLQSYLRLIDNQSDDVSLAASLHSYFGGLTNDELSIIRNEFYDADYFYEAAMQYSFLSNDLGIKVKDFFDKLDRYRTLSKCMSVSELAGLITAETDYFKYALSLSVSEGAALEAYYKKMGESSHNASLYAFIKYCDICPQLEITQTEGNAVKLMTIHGSKGLEFPFVILADLGHKFNTKDSSETMLLNENGYSLKHFDMAERKAKKTSQYAFLQSRLNITQREEQLRVLYVALTRAKIGLSLFGALPKKEKDVAVQEANCYLDWLMPHLSFAEIKESNEFNFSKPEKSNIIFAKPNAQLCELISKRINFKYAGSHDFIKTNVTKMIADDNAEQAIVFSHGGDTDDRALKAGTAYHKFLQELNFLEDFSQEWQRLEPILGESISYLDKEKLSKAANIFKGITYGKTCRKELPFIYNNNGQFVQGIIDLIIIEDNLATIIDYKTGANPRAKLADYTKQLNLYSQAVGGILKINNIKKLIYSIENAEFIEII